VSAIVDEVQYICILTVSSTGRGSTENDLKLRPSPCERPRRSISLASAAFPVATPETSTWTCVSEGLACMTFRSICFPLQAAD
jgi:hypothetical protein